MAEDDFVQMLLEVAAGGVTDERDIDLARAAARWATADGRWQLHLHNGYVVPGQGLDRWVRTNRIEHVLEVRVRLGAGEWHPHTSWPIASVGHGLNMLAAEGLIPARYCTLGRQALEDHAEALWRAAIRIVQGPDGGELVDWAAGMSEAAESARRFSAAPLAVLA